MKPVRYLFLLLFILVMVLPSSASAATWSLMTTTNPEPQNSLLDISCTKATECTAVGSTQAVSESANGTLAERWNGASWATQTTPEQKETEGRPELSGVSCVSSTLCLAVGTSGLLKAIAEQWDGSKWSTQVFAEPMGAKFVLPQDISCTASTACTAVGGYTTASAGLPLAERWNGKEWSIQTVPVPESAKAVRFDGVSCTTVEACVAVGHYTNAEGTILTLAERWNGKEWSIQTTVNPIGETISVLLDISCLGAETCTAVGGAQHGANTQKTLVERWNGKEWLIQASPNPTGAKASVLQGVSCVSAESCIAVGDFVDASPKNVTLGESWNGKEWSIQTTVNPTGSTFAALWSVSCLTSTNCFASGSYVKEFSKTLVEQFS